MTSPRLRAWLIAIVAGVVSLSFLAVARFRDWQEAWVVVIVGFAVNFVAALFAVSLRLSRLERKIDAAATAGHLGDLKAFWSVPRIDKNWLVLFGGRQSDGDPDIRIAYSTVYAYSQIEALLHRLYGPVSVTLMSCREIKDWSVVSSYNLVVLGGVVSIPGMKQIFEVLDTRSRQAVDTSNQRSITFHERFTTSVFNTKATGAEVVEDHAVVLRVVDAVSGFALFTFSGGWGAGTVGGALAATTRERFNAAGFDGARELNETIVSTSDIRDARVHRQSPSVFCRVWDARNVAADTIRSVEQIVTSGQLAGDTGWR